jgi:uncharacterized membrane protein YedE/YeeE
VGKWGFIWLAYGVAGGAMLVYLVSLWRRLCEAAGEVTALEGGPGRSVR